MLVSCFGRAIVGPCTALAASISVTGLGVSSLTRSGLWEPHSPGGRFAVILSPSMQRNPLDQGRRPGSPLELCFFICILRRQVGLRIQPPRQKLSWIDHWGLRLQSSLLANWVAVTCLNQLGALSLLPLVVGTTRGGAEHCLPPPPVGCLITCMLLQSCKALSQQKSPPSGKLRYYRFCRHNYFVVFISQTAIKKT